jgi:outer membrane protein OmpA-like peptidoglycan-associated protein
MSYRLLLAALALASTCAMAEDVRVYRGSETVDPGEVAAILDQSAQKPVKMRGLKLLDDQPLAKAAASESHSGGGGQPVPAPAEQPAPSAPSALALPVQFAFDSAEILAAARPQLDALVAGIRLLPAAQAVRIEGHTDATGASRYNELLSQKRANAVKQYLVAQGIDAQRLRAVGLGSTAPLPGRDPHAAEQRRVQFRGE